MSSDLETAIERAIEDISLLATAIHDVPKESSSNSDELFSKFDKFASHLQKIDSLSATADKSSVSIEILRWIDSGSNPDQFVAEHLADVIRFEQSNAGKSRAIQQLRDRLLPPSSLNNASV